eukprot:TRINITY_DN2366_c0_g2_i3.p1 TRINITY_DN2366_c0_g2~~TRINITY_DN2366_c0_g2_i3.p1  ORF type:complete len:179 (-),score=33.02 TRINITY_DN2366_c0_g2_i3:63-599(-)
MSIFAGPYYPAKRESPLASQHAKPERFLSATRLRPRIDPLSQKTPRDAVRPDADLSVAKVLFSPSSDAPAKPRPQSAPARPKGISDALPHDTKCWKRNFVAINRKACAAGSAYSQARKEESLKPRLHVVQIDGENSFVEDFHLNKFCFHATYFDLMNADSLSASWWTPTWALHINYLQ